jgi:hypothetical protein
MEHVEDFARGIGREMLRLDAASKARRIRCTGSLGGRHGGLAKAMRDSLTEALATQPSFEKTF